MISCSQDKHNFSVEVRVNGAKGEIMYLARRTISGTAIVDSSLPDKSGKYLLEGYTQQPDFYIVYHRPRNFINLIIHPGDEFRVLTNASSFDIDYIVEGSKDSRLIQKLVNMQTRTLEMITAISEKYETSRGGKDFDNVKSVIDSTYEKIFQDHKNFSIALIRENPGSLASLMTLYQQLGRNTPVFDYKKDFRYFEMVDSNLVNLYPDSEAVIDLNRKITELREMLILEPGSLAPEITLSDSTGQVVTLSSLRGKNVVLMFWASWSTPSIEELKRLAVAYKNFKNKAVEYYQVSLDRSKNSWVKGISIANPSGIHVSDLKYWDSPVVEQFHIEKLPVIILLNKEGIIIKRDIKAAELENLL
jgi:thiol-disulfide isomerase/thioredoxin